MKNEFYLSVRKDTGSGDDKAFFNGFHYSKSM